MADALPEESQSALAGHDPIQIELMKEMCILVDENDHVIGQSPKGVCHLNDKIAEGMLHRAFSVFLFNHEGKLLLQQRAAEKVTFAHYWTNTCCSHPLHTASGTEEEEGDAIGVKRAAKRKLVQELGLDVPLEKFEYVTRIHYKAPSDGKWGEHEIDYVLFVQLDQQPATNVFNPNEVQAVRVVNPEELRALLATATAQGLHITPWFELICNSKLFGWWDQLRTKTPVATFSDHQTIHRLGM